MTALPSFVAPATISATLEIRWMQLLYDSDNLKKLEEFPPEEVATLPKEFRVIAQQMLDIPRLYRHDPMRGISLLKEAVELASTSFTINILGAVQHVMTRILQPYAPAVANPVAPQGTLDPQIVQAIASCPSAMNDLDEIIPGLFIGGIKACKQVKALGITRIVRVTNERSAQEYISHLPPPCEIPVADIADKTTWKLLKSHFPKAFRYIDEALAQKEKVLVHCALGASRSSSVVIAYLMEKGKKEKGLNFERFYSFVRSKRPPTQPNAAFGIGLIEYWKELQDQQKSPSCNGAPQEKKEGA